MWCLTNVVFKGQRTAFRFAAGIELVKIKSFTRWIFELVLGQQTQDIAMVRSCISRTNDAPLQHLILCLQLRVPRRILSIRFVCSYVVPQKVTALQSSLVP